MSTAAVDAAEGIRRVLGTARPGDTIYVAVPDPQVAMYWFGPENRTQLPRKALLVRRFRAPMPFTGPTVLMYEGLVAVDTERPNLPVAFGEFEILDTGWKWYTDWQTAPMR